MWVVRLKGPLYCFSSARSHHHGGGVRSSTCNKITGNAISIYTPSFWRIFPEVKKVTTFVSRRNPRVIGGVTHCEDFSSRVLCRVGIGGCPNSCLRRSTSCLAIAYSPSVKVAILTRRSVHLETVRYQYADYFRARAYILPID